MNDSASSDQAAQQKNHQQYSAECFNRTWGFLDKQVRSAEDELKMLSSAHASLFHWMEREDCTPRNLSIGLWQVSRVYAVLGSAQEAMRFGMEALRVSEENKLDSFCLAYAHEAVSRAALVGGNRDLAQVHLEKMKEYAAEVTEEFDKKLLSNDAKDLESKM